MAATTSIGFGQLRLGELHGLYATQVQQCSLISQAMLKALAEAKTSTFAEAMVQAVPDAENPESAKKRTELLEQLRQVIDLMQALDKEIHSR